MLYFQHEAQLLILHQRNYSRNKIKPKYLINTKIFYLFLNNFISLLKYFCLIFKLLIIFKRIFSSWIIKYTLSHCYCWIKWASPLLFMKLVSILKGNCCFLSLIFFIVLADRYRWTLIAFVIKIIWIKWFWFLMTHFLLLLFTFLICFT